MFPIIAARSTAVGSGAVCVIRISGLSCHKICAPFFSLSKFEIRHAHYCYFLDPKTQTKLDDVVATFFASPHSYTGEDSIEFSCHGGSFISEKLLTVLYTNGLKPAEPGEFSRRAVLNGRMDLTQAEGVKALIEAVSEQEWRAGRSLLDGGLKLKVADLRSKIISVLAYLEARIDFPEEDDVKVDMSDVNNQLLKIQSDLEALKESYKDGKVAYEGLKVAIIGPPNSGKSTLLNFLLKKNRALVSDVPGTTRDYIEEKCLIKGRLLRLVDTAGVRETAETIEKMGIALSFEIAKLADVVVLLSDGTAEVGIDSLQNKKILRIQTKSDLNMKLKGGTEFAISCHTGENCNKLLDRLAGICDSHLVGVEDQVFLANERQFSAIKNALSFFEKYWLINLSKGVDECLAFELQEAVRALESLIGTVTNDAVLDKIFSEFCVGK